MFWTPLWEPGPSSRGSCKAVLLIGITCFASTPPNCTPTRLCCWLITSPPSTSRWPTPRSRASTSRSRASCSPIPSRHLRPPTKETRRSSPATTLGLSDSLDWTSASSLSNPPWSSGQGSYEDDNANQELPHAGRQDCPQLHRVVGLQGIEELPQYDSYVRAIRWASDRVQAGDGGVVGFVTNSGFLDGKSFRRLPQDTGEGVP